MRALIFGPYMTCVFVMCPICSGAAGLGGALLSTARQLHRVRSCAMHLATLETQEALETLETLQALQMYACIVANRVHMYSGLTGHACILV